WGRGVGVLQSRGAGRAPSNRAPPPGEPASREGRGRPPRGSTVGGPFSMGHDRPYHYTPICDVEGCDRPATFKVGASWSDGTQSEMKNFGVYCSDHATEQMELAQQRQAGIRPAPGERVGPIRLYELVGGRLDVELIPVA